MHEKHKGGKTHGAKGDLDPDDVADEEEIDLDQDGQEAIDLMFKVIIEKPHPSEVKISKKNVSVVTITQNEDVWKE